jgi:hypothetical protein
MVKQKKNACLADDFIFGGPAIAKELGIPDRKLYYLAASGQLGDAVQKLGPKTLVASREKLRLRLGLVAPPSASAA